MDFVTLGAKFWRFLAQKNAVSRVTQTKYFLDGRLTHYVCLPTMYVRGMGGFPFSRETIKISSPSQDQNHSD